MKLFHLLPVFLFLQFLTVRISAQETISTQADSLLKARGEVFFQFSCTSPETIKRIGRYLSIDKTDSGRVFAYANRKSFTRFLSENIPFTLLTPPGLLPTRADLIKTSSPDNGSWDFYPSFPGYLQWMQSFAQEYPAICRLDTIGVSIANRNLLAVKISDQATTKEAEPAIFFTSGIHGDETAGYVLMLHLIDYLLSGYGTDPRITELINENEIYINPLANPDGTYYTSEDSPYGAIRFNANHIDLNRNYPDPEAGLHPDGEAWQKETLAFMEYAGDNHFTLSVNFHGGAELFNYPWDTWAKLPADDPWWQFTGREWADTAHLYAPAGYFDDMDNGVSNGYQWYEVKGGRQDYMNYWQHCREVTVEISNIKLLPVNLLENFWSYNFRSFLNFMEQARYGITGLVTDSATGSPLRARVTIDGHDLDSSDVYSDSRTGFYARPVLPGTYDLIVSASGYHSRMVTAVTVSPGQMTSLDIRLKSNAQGMEDNIDMDLVVSPNPGSGYFTVFFEDPCWKPVILHVFNGQGKEILRHQWKGRGEKTISFDLSAQPTGLYLMKTDFGDRSVTCRLVLVAR